MGIDNILIYHPESYHGEGKKNFFEGWYFKNTSSNGSYVFAIIPGISIGSDSHSFIQVIDNRGYSKYFRFEFSDFKFSNKPFWVKIKDNYFSLEKIKINLENFEGQLIFKGLKPWPVSIFSPGVMGPFGVMHPEKLDRNYETFVKLRYSSYTSRGLLYFNALCGYLLL
jgi:hypothetical protein